MGGDTDSNTCSTHSHIQSGDGSRINLGTKKKKNGQKRKKKSKATTKFMKHKSGGKEVKMLPTVGNGDGDLQWRN